MQTGRLIDRQAARPGSRVAAPVMLRSLSRSEVVLFCFVFFTAEGKSVISETCNRCATDGACLFVPFPLKSQTSERVAVPPPPLPATILDLRAARRSQDCACRAGGEKTLRFPCGQVWKCSACLHTYGLQTLFFFGAAADAESDGLGLGGLGGLREGLRVRPVIR